MTECSGTSVLVSLLYSSGQAKRELSVAERRYALHREPSSSDCGHSDTSTCEELQTKEIWRPLAAHVDGINLVTLNCSFRLLGTLSSGLKRRFCERMIGRPGDLLAVKGGKSNPESRKFTHAVSTSRLRKASRL
ncbi:hypothetical protein Bbelb_391240 [Branchiostoma belcheri]|nr:hypothetical protein Bbelb_391240 [Branchiostoma belcheri]